MRAFFSSGILVALACLLTGGLPNHADEPSEVYKSWTQMSVPGTWDEHSAGKLADYDGFAWYRCRAEVPDSWKGKDLQLWVEGVDNAHEAYFNGTKVGSAGAFPPKYKSGLHESNKYTVPAKLVRPGKYNFVAIRVFDHDGRGGFKGTAPALVNGNRAVALAGKWEFRLGDDLKWATSDSKQRARIAMYSKLFATSSLKNVKSLAGNTDPLSPAAAFKQFVVPDDLKIEELLTEPTVKQPLFVNFDERGRMWVINYLQYPYPAGLKMVSRDKFWRAVYDKVPPPPPNHFKGADRITIHEDTDGDGKFDKHKVFLEGLNIATSCVKGRGGVWVLNPPYLMFYPDKNNDDVPDGDPVVHLAGFGLQDTHSVVNSLRWGPDGWLYAAQGSTVTGNVLRPGLDKRGVFSMGQLIWRYHPETKRYEIFAEGGGNAFGVEIDAKGRIFSGHNGGDTRGFHYVQGGYSRKGFTKHGPLSNPYAFGFFAAMKHAKVPRFTHKFVIYEGGSSLPERYHGKLFGVEPLQGKVVQAEITPDGSSYQTKDLNRPVATSDGRFRPVDIKVGPDGAIYFCDFYEPLIAHRQHFEGQIDKENGRIYRIQGKNAKPIKPFDLGKKSTRELVVVLDHPNKWFRQTALRLIADRKDASVIPLLKKRIQEMSGQSALESLWALNLSGGFDDDIALQTLDHEDPFVRLWTVRLLCDDKRVERVIARKLAAVSEREPYVQVRSQLASSAKRLPAADGLPIVRNLLTHQEDAGDVHMPLLLWWAIESKCANDADAVLALFADKAVWNEPIVTDHLLDRLMRRFALSGTRKDLLACARLIDSAPGKHHRDLLMKGFEAAYKGRPLTGLPTELVAALSKAGGGSVSLGLRQGQADAVQKALTAIADERAPVAKRIEYIEIFGEVPQPSSVPVMLSVLKKTKQDKVRMTILTALLRYDDAHIADEVIGLYNDQSDDVRSVAQTLLSSRKNWTRSFLEAVEKKKIAADSIPLDVVRKMTVHRDKRIASLIGEHWGAIEGATNEEMQQRIERFTTALKNGSGDPYNGKKLFSKTCAKCHVLFAQGGRIGPDLTSYKRDDLFRMLINVVNPSAEIREGFENYLIITEDGRTMTGFLLDRDNRVVVLKGQDGQSITIARDTIDEMLPQKKSLMPEGLLKDLNDQQVRDLFAYFRSQQPLNN